MKPIFFLAATVAIATAAPDGEQLFITNCSACHQPEQSLVGPSLAEIRSLYLKKPEDFVKWSIAPVKKRPNVIEMPSMVHVGEEGLLAIHKHVMKISEKLVDKKQGKGDPFEKSPTQSVRPQVQRIFMPQASPASIAVALDEKISLCWDAGPCRLRYVWTGGFIDGFPYWQGNGNALPKIIGTRRYLENTSPFPSDVEPSFQGYEIKEGLPIFRYKIGALEVTEAFAPLAVGEGFTRSFTIDPAPSTGLTLKFPSDQKVELSSDKGTWSGSELTVPTAAAAAFTITFSLK